MRSALLGVGVAVAAGILLLVALGSELRRAGTNNVPGGSTIERLEAGERKCQPAEVPGDTGWLAIPAIGELESPVRLAVAVRDTTGRRVAAGVTRKRAPSGYPLARMHPWPPAGTAKVCVTNVGRYAVGLQGTAGIFGIDYYRPEPQSWLGLAPALAERFSLGKTGVVGGWAFWLALAFVAGAWIAGWLGLAESRSRGSGSAAR